MEQQRQTYHHKDLRNALIETGIQIVNTEGVYDYWLFLFCDRKTNRHFLYIKWNSGKYTIIFIDMAVSGDIAMFLFHIFNSIPLLKKAYSMQRSFATIEMNTQIIIIA